MVTHGAQENMIIDDQHTSYTDHRRRHTISSTSLTLLIILFIGLLTVIVFLVFHLTNHCHLTLPILNNNDIKCTNDVIILTTSTVRNDELMIVTNTTSQKDVMDIRLPRTIRPLSYNISIEPQFQEDNFTFNGSVQIHIHVLEDCYNITMHAFQLNIPKDEVQVSPINFNETKVFHKTLNLNLRKQYFLEYQQFYVIELIDKLIAHQDYIISINFNGLMQDYLKGFYRSSYKTKQNETRWLASTQFEPTDARQAFPCFDEPELKAKFTLHIARPCNMTSISNMPILYTSKHNSLPDYEWDHFDESLPMSTYLVAYSIMDFSQMKQDNFSVWTRPEAIQSAKYALSIGPKILKFLEIFFDLKFPLPKIDMIALPDFQAGAMENWGLVTFRETAMLFDEGVSPIPYKQRIALVVSHELAHQWFGNLVTPSWWSDIWLNEGFANYMEYLTVDAIEPNWKTMDQFVVNELQNVFQLDALSSSHKISIKVYNPDEITSIFDDISYAKGATIIRMMSHYLTSTVFRKALTRYLKEMAYSSAEQDDLWYYLTSEASSAKLLDGNVTVKDIMDTWTLQVGYPVVSISINEENSVIRLEQERFIFKNQRLQNRVENDIDDAPLWWIPITYTTMEEMNFENTYPVTWISRTKIHEIHNKNITKAKWFIFNIQESGYYRVNYDLSNWQAITEYLLDPELFRNIAASNRAQLIDDSLNLAFGGYIAYDVALNLTRYLKHELDYVPWKSALNAFNFIDSMFINQGEYDLFKNYLLKLLDNVYKDVGFLEPKDELDMLKHSKRIGILRMACHLGHKQCISECVRHFQNWIEVPNPDMNNPISPNLRGIVYCNAILYGTELEWNFAYERYLKTSVATEKEILLTALGCSNVPWILFRYLRYSIGDNAIRKQDIYRVFSVVASNVVGQQIVFDFVRANWQFIKSYLGSSVSNLYTLLHFSTRRMNSKYQLRELESFVKNELKDNSRTIQQIVEQVEIHVNWMNQNYENIVRWLRNDIFI